MNTIPLRDKACLLLARRQMHAGAGFYLRQNARRHLLFSALFWLIVIALWALGQQAVAFVIAGFWAGRLVRDLQWYRALATEWITTSELLDWPKIEALAASPEPDRV